MDEYLLRNGTITLRADVLPDIYAKIPDTDIPSSMDKYFFGRLKIFPLICKYFVPYLYHRKYVDNGYYVAYPDKRLYTTQQIIVDEYVLCAQKFNAVKFSRHSMATRLYCSLIIQKNYVAAKNLLRDFVRYGFLYDLQLSFELYENADSELIMDVIRVYGPKRGRRYAKQLIIFAANFLMYKIFDMMILEFGISKRTMHEIIDAHTAKMTSEYALVFRDKYVDVKKYIDNL